MSTPAPDLETIYDVEEAVESASKAILLADGIEAFMQREVDDLPAARVDVQLQLGQPTLHKSQVTPGQFALDAWNGLLRFEIWTPRLLSDHADYDPKLHGRLRAKVRHAIQYFADRFTETVLPYHVLTKIVERDTMPSVVVDDDADLSQITCDVIVSVRKGCWPV